jgi:hypothetical protein
MSENTIDPIDIDYDAAITDAPVVDAAPTSPEADVDPVIDPEPDADPLNVAVADPVVEPVIEPVTDPVAATTEPDAEAEAEPGEAEPTVVSEVMAAFGYDDIDGEFEDTQEGLVEMTKAVANRMVNDQLERTFDVHPTVKAHLDYVNKGGDPAKFMEAFTPEHDFGAVELTAEDIPAQKAMLTNFFKAQGQDEVFINDMIESYEDKGVLHERSLVGQTKLVEARDMKRAHVVAENNAMHEARLADDRETWGKVQSIVSTAKDISGITLTERERTPFMDYISKPVDGEGRTQRELDTNKMTLEQQLAVDYLVYKGMDLKKFISTKAGTQAAKTLRGTLSKSAKGPKSTRTNTAPVANVAESLDLDLTSL